MSDSQTSSQPKRIAIFSRYNLAEQYDLAAEFEGMLKNLAGRSPVLHLSLRGTRDLPSIPANVRVEELPLRIDRQSPRDILIKSLLMYFHLPAAAVRLRRFKPDVIFLTEILPLVGLFLKWMTGARVATFYGDWHFHNLFGRKAWGKPLLGIVEALDRFEVRRLNGFMCRAAAAGERVQRWGVPADRVRVVRDAPDPEAFFPRDARDLRRRCGFSDDDVVLLYHGVMHCGKGLDKLMTWSNELHREDGKIGLILVGGGPEEKPLRDLAATLDIGKRVFFTGWLKTVKEVGDYCNAADICIAMRTKAEANDRVVPGALLHSMACRKVVIGPRLSGIAEILREGENGFMFAADDGADFKRLIRELIRDRAGWARVSERAYRDIVEKYSVQAAAKQYAEALEHFATT
jgi:glycosyltransferase involved in cell wall biosynthesis